VIKETPPPHTNPAPPAVSPPPQSSVQTNFLPVAESPLETNPVPPVAIAETPTNGAVPAMAEPTPPAAVPPVSITRTDSNGGFTATAELSKGALLAIAGGILLIVVAAIWIIVRSRRHDSASLITESLEKR
jgi:hypothetical protein